MFFLSAIKMVGLFAKHKAVKKPHKKFDWGKAADIGMGLFDSIAKPVASMFGLGGVADEVSYGLHSLRESTRRQPSNPSHSNALVRRRREPTIEEVLDEED
jgi:hypothetical protein